MRRTTRARAVFTWMLQRLADAGLVKGKTVRKGSNDDWTHPHNPDAKITRMKDGRTHTNTRKRLLIHSGGFNLGLLVERLIGVGTPQGLQRRLLAIPGGLLILLRQVEPVRFLLAYLVKAASGSSCSKERSN